MNRIAFGLVALLVITASVSADEKSGVVVDKDKRTVTIDAKMAPRKLADEKFQGKIYPIEVIACWPYPKGQKAHETIVTIECKPSEVHAGLEALGLKPGTPVMGESKDAPKGPKVNIYLEFAGADGEMKRIPIEKTMIDPKTNKAMPKVEWRFTGSVMSAAAADKPDEKTYGADLSGTLIAIFPVTNQTVMQTELTMKEEKYLKLETNKDLLPKEGASVKLVLEVPAK